MSYLFTHQINLTRQTNGMVYHNNITSFPIPLFYFTMPIIRKYEGKTYEEVIRVRCNGDVYMHWEEILEREDLEDRINAAALSYGMGKYREKKIYERKYKAK